MTQTDDLQQLLQQAKNLNSYTTNIASIYSISKRLSANAPPATKQLDHLNYFQNAFHKRKGSKLDKNQEYEQKAIRHALNANTLRYDKYMKSQLDFIYNDLINELKENTLSLSPQQSVFNLVIKDNTANKFKSIPISEWPDANKSSRIWQLIRSIHNQSSINDIINKSKEFFQVEFSQVMQSICQRNPEVAKLGNNFDPQQLVESFIRVKHMQGTPSQKIYFLLRIGVPQSLKDLKFKDGDNDVYSYALMKLRGDVLTPQQSSELQRHIHVTWEHYFWHILYIYPNNKSVLDELKLNTGSPHDIALKCFAIGKYGLALFHLLQDQNASLDAVHIALFLHNNDKLELPTTISISNMIYNNTTHQFYLHNLMISYLQQLSNIHDKILYLSFMVTQNNKIYCSFVKKQFTFLLVHCNKQELTLLCDLDKKMDICKQLQMDTLEFDNQCSQAATQALGEAKIEIALFLWDIVKDYDTVIRKLNQSLAHLIQGVPLYTFQKNELINCSVKYIKEHRHETVMTSRLLDIVGFMDNLTEQEYGKAVEYLVGDKVFKQRQNVYYLDDDLLRELPDVTKLVLGGLECVGRSWMRELTAEESQLARKQRLERLVGLKEKLVGLIHQNSSYFGKEVFSKSELLDVQMVDFMR